MGVFFETGRVRSADVKNVIKDALETDPTTVGDSDAVAEERAAEIAPAGYGKFIPARFIGALVIFAVIVVAAIATEATDLDESSTALWGFAATIFGVVVGFLAGEKSAAG